MTLTLLIHGNPGSAADLEPLAAAFRAAGEGEARVVERAAGGESLRALTDQIDRAGSSDRLRVVAYSYGAWLAMQHALRGSRKPDALVLVNPYLVVERPLSSAAALIATAPVVGDAIMRRKTPALADQFVADVFAPAQPPPDAAALRERLNDPAVWQGALRYKRLQQQAPLEPLDALPCPTRVIIGEADRVADWKRQMTAFGRALTAIDLRTIEGAGHALPWTHPEEVARIAREESK